MSSSSCMVALNLGDSSPGRSVLTKDKEIKLRKQQLRYAMLQDLKPSNNWRLIPMPPVVLQSTYPAQISARSPPPFPLLSFLVLPCRITDLAFRARTLPIRDLLPEKKLFSPLMHVRSAAPLTEGNQPSSSSPPFRPENVNGQISLLKAGRGGGSREGFFPTASHSIHARGGE